MTSLAPAPTVTRVASSERRWLAVARAAWLLVLILALALLVPNLGLQFNQYQATCSGDGCANFLLSPAQAAELPRLGLSLPLMAAYFTALAAVHALVFVAIAAVIFWRKSDDRLALYMMFALVLFGIGNVLDVSVPRTTLAQSLLVLFQGLGRAGLACFFLVFPDGRFVPSWTRWLAPFVAAREVIGAFVPGSLIDALFFVVAPLIVLLQVYRYRQASNAVQRQQTKWVVYGSVVGVLLYVGLTLFVQAASPRGAPPGALSVIVFNTGEILALTLIPISVGMAILRSHLWDIDILIRRTILFGVLTALLGGAYLGFVILLQGAFTVLTRLSGARATGAGHSELVTVLSTLVIAALFVPLRRRLQGAIDRRFYRRKYDSAKTLADFGAALRNDPTADLARLSDQLLAVVDETMQPETANLWLARPGGTTPPAHLLRK